MNRPGTWVPPHVAAPEGRARRAAVAVLDTVRAWDRLPGRVQGVFCGCPMCKGEREDRDKRLLIAGAVIGFGLALLAVTFAGACLLTPVPAVWQAVAGIAVSGSVVYAGICAMPEDPEDDS